MEEILNFVNSEEDTTEVPIYTDEEQEYFYKLWEEDRL
jgi:hypothetical protein